MGQYVEGQDRTQSVLFPERIDDWIHEDSTVRIIDVVVDELALRQLGFERADPAARGRPGYCQVTLLKIYVYGDPKAPDISSLHACSGCFRLKRLPGGTCTRWIAPLEERLRRLLYRSFRQAAT